MVTSAGHLRCILALEDMMYQALTISADAEMSMNFNPSQRLQLKQ